MCIIYEALTVFAGEAMWLKVTVSVFLVTLFQEPVGNTDGSMFKMGGPLCGAGCALLVLTPSCFLIPLWGFEAVRLSQGLFADLSLCCHFFLSLQVGGICNKIDNYWGRDNSERETSMGLPSKSQIVSLLWRLGNPLVIKWLAHSLVHTKYLPKKW